MSRYRAALVGHMLVAALTSLPQAAGEEKAEEESYKPSHIPGTRAYRNAEKRMRKKQKKKK